MIVVLKEHDQFTHYYTFICIIGKVCILYTDILVQLKPIAMKTCTGNKHILTTWVHQTTIIATAHKDYIPTVSEAMFSSGGLVLTSYNFKLSSKMITNE